MNQFALIFVIAAGCSIVIGFIVSVFASIIENDSKEETPEEKFKKFYRKKKDGPCFFLCDYCTKCKIKYTHKSFEKPITSRILAEDCPIDEGLNLINVKICNKFELDKNKI